MSEFTESIRVRPSFDHRFDPQQWQKGCGSVRVEFTLGGPLGFVTSTIDTGWMSEPLTQVPVEYGRGWRGPWTNPVRAVGKVGPDVFSRDHERPLAGSISCHAPKPPAGKEWFTPASGCTLIEGGVCYGDTGYLVGDTFLSRLAEGGDEAGFSYLREIHDDWLADEVQP